MTDSAADQRAIAATIAARVQSAMTRRGVTKIWLARHLGLATSTPLSLKLSGSRSWSALDLVRIGAALDTDPGTFLQHLPSSAVRS